MTFNLLMIPVWLTLGVFFGIWLHVILACVRDWLGYLRSLPGIDTQIRWLNNFYLPKAKDSDSLS